MTRRGRPLRARRWVVPPLAVVAVLSWAAVAGIGGLGAADILAAALAGIAGVLAARPLARLLAQLLRRVRGGARGPESRTSADAPPATPEPLPGGSTEAEVMALLRRLCRMLQARRIVVWEPDPAKERLVPVHASDPVPPGPIAAAGDPLSWALAQDQPLRLGGTPAWADGPTTAAPLGDRLVLTAEGHDEAPDPAAAAAAAAIIAGFLALEERKRRAVDLSRRFERFITFLETLTGGAEPGRFPDVLARALTEMADADGAVVAAWSDERGRVLAAAGSGGGPAAGTYFGVMDGDLAMAARAGTPIRRDRTGRMHPLAHAGERWSRPPEHLAVIPLMDGAGTAGGACALWCDAPLDDAAIQLVQALGPMLSLQLQHSTDLVHFRQRAHEDVLTGLRNRAALEERLLDERNRFHRYRRPVSLLVLDLDHFKRINDTWGHAAGDAILARVAEIVRAAIRDADAAYRFGGEEMVVLLPETMRREAGEVAERIRKAVGTARIEWGDRVIPVTLSIGVSSCPETVEDPALLLKSADQALYHSKDTGRNRVTVAVPEG